MTVGHLSPVGERRKASSNTPADQWPPPSTTTLANGTGERRQQQPEEESLSSATRSLPKSATGGRTAAAAAAADSQVSQRQMQQHASNTTNNPFSFSSLNSKQQLGKLSLTNEDNPLLATTQQQQLALSSASSQSLTSSTDDEFKSLQARKPTAPTATNANAAQLNSIKQLADNSSIFTGQYSARQQQQMQHRQRKQHQQSSVFKDDMSSDQWTRKSKPHKVQTGGWSLLGNCNSYLQSKALLGGRRRGYDAEYNQNDDEASTTNSDDLTFMQTAWKRAKLLAWLCLKGLCLFAALLIINSIVVYFWPIDAEFRVEPLVAPARPRPAYSGPLSVNEQLDQLGELLFAGQFHAPESMAWTADKRAFYTGVEGGFILFVEPYAERWTIAAKLNGRNSVLDKSRRTRFESQPANEDDHQKHSADNKQFVPFCTRDVELYGRRAEFEPNLVRLSRCSRPLGLRLAPNDTHLYAMDPLSGLYRIDLDSSNRNKNQVSKLADFSYHQQRRALNADEAEHRILFGDDITVDWAQPGQSDVIYFTDCSKRWPVRYLLWLMLENDDSGRIFAFNTSDQVLRPLKAVVPVHYRDKQQNTRVDQRGLSFPNGIELSANKSALLISDLNNRRVLMHHLQGPNAGQTEHLMWLPGYADNIRRGLDEPDGGATYWFACGCAITDGRFELAEFFNDFPRLKVVLLKTLYLTGSLVDWLAELLDSTSLRDGGFMISAGWLKYDPYCTHGLVGQFNERGEILRSLHGPSFGSKFKLLSEAHQVPLVGDADGARQQQNATTVATANTQRSALYLGSVYYSYLGRIELN